MLAVLGTTATKLQPLFVRVASLEATTTEKERRNATCAHREHSVILMLLLRVLSAVLEITRTRKGRLRAHLVIQAPLLQITRLPRVQTVLQVSSSIHLVDEVVTVARRENTPTPPSLLSASNALEELMLLLEAWPTVLTVLRERLTTIKLVLLTVHLVQRGIITTKQDKQSAWNVQQAHSPATQDKPHVPLARQVMPPVQQGRTAARPANQAISLLTKDLQHVMNVMLERTVIGKVP